MKYLKVFSVLFVALVTAALVYADAQTVTARVRAVRGSAKYKTNGEWHALKVNDVLKAGTVIETGTESSVDLFVNQSVIRVTPDTTIGLEKLLATDTGADKVLETSLQLRSGRILVNVKKLAAASRYEIRTPNGVTGIRGTDFDISFINARLTVTSVNGTLVGSAANNQGDIKTAVINTGETWSPEDGLGKAPEELIAAARSIIIDMTQPENPPVVPQPPAVLDYVPPTIGASQNTP